MNYSLKSCLLYVMPAIIFSFIAFKTLAQSTINHSSFDSMKAIKEISAQTSLYIDALSKSDSSALANLYVNNARILNDGIPSTIGKEAIVHFYGYMIRNGLTRFTYVTTGVWGSDNNFVVEDGTLVFAHASGKPIVKGRYLLVWKRENGVLKIFRDTFFSDSK